MTIDALLLASGNPLDLYNALPVLLLRPLACSPARSLACLYRLPVNLFTCAPVHLSVHLLVLSLVRSSRITTFAVAAAALTAALTTHNPTHHDGVPPT